MRARFLVNCGGLHCDRVARLCGVDPRVRIVPFRGEYYELAAGSAHLVKHLIYPVPDPRFPFLGVHFTRMIHGGIEAGPNAVLAFKREGYTRWSFSPRDMLEIAAYGGFWRMAVKYWRMGFAEFHRSFSKKAFVKALQGLVPEIGLDDVEPNASLMSLGGAVFFQIAGDERYGFDIGARGQYMTVSGEVDLSGLEVREDETIKATLSGLAFGPVLRGRWYLVEDSIALGPEIYFCYSSWSTELEAFGESADGPGATILNLEYSLRMDFYF